MYSRMKRKCSFIVLVVMVVSLLMVSGTPVHADSYSWMESAKKVKINSTIKGVARNNQPPTLMDPWDSYEEYFYFKAPVKMNITITVTMKGTQGVSMSLYNSRGNYMRDTVPDIVGVYDGANYGMLGSNGELIVPCSYDSCEISEDGAYITADRQKDEYGNYTECTLFDSNGNKIETFDTGIYNVGVFRKISNAA